MELLRIPVHVLGTPMVYSVPVEQCALESSSAIAMYCPGEVVSHPVLGRLLCEEMNFRSGTKDVERVYCRLLDQHGSPSPCQEERCLGEQCSHCFQDSLQYIQYAGQTCPIERGFAMSAFLWDKNKHSLPDPNECAVCDHHKTQLFQFEDCCAGCRTEIIKRTMHRIGFLDANGALQPLEELEMGCMMWATHSKIK